MKKTLLALALIASSAHAQSLQDLTKIIAIQQATLKSIKKDVKLYAHIVTDRVVGFALDGRDGLENRGGVVQTNNRWLEAGQASLFKESSCLLENRGAEQNKNLNSSGSISITAWIKPEKLSSGMIAAKHFTHNKRSWNLNMEGGQLRFQIIGADNAVFGLNAAYPSDGKWHHVAAVYSKGLGKMTIYIDGIAAASQLVGIVTIMNSSMPITVGCYLNSDDGSVLRDYYVGEIDEISVFNRPLTEEQLALLLSFE